MKQYVVTFDYGHQKMYFAPGGSPNATAMTAPACG